MASNAQFDLTLESTAFDCDNLRVRKLSGTEAISRLFHFELEVVSHDRTGPTAASMLGAPVTICFQSFAPDAQRGPGGRRIHGMVAEVDEVLSGSRQKRVHRLRVAPRAHRLTMAETQDILMDASVPEMIQQKLGAVGLEGADVALRLSGTYAPREFVVQYRESDLAFVSRLAEHLGISFFFDHESGIDQLVLTDHADGFGSPGPRPVFHFHDDGDQAEVFALEAKHRLIPSFYAVSDYNYRLPLVDLTIERALDDGYAGGVIEHGTHHKTPDQGRMIVQARAEERRASQLVYTGSSGLAALGAGTRFRLVGHPELDPLDLLVVEVQHEAEQIVDLAGEGSEQRCTNTFRAIPADRTYRPPRATPRPRIAGLLTGVIDAGPLGPGKYARVDDQGRYWVRFLFDTTATGQRRVSHPVRMLQDHVGESFGTHFPLKPGVEVLVGFVDGDPDRPVIVGAAPNPLKPSPVTSAEPGMHRTRTATGVTVEMK